MGRGRLRLDRSDAAGGCAALLLAAAAAVSSARDVLLVGAICASITWVAWDAHRNGEPGPRARLIMAIALAALVALPASLLVADHRLWAGPFPGLAGGLGLWATGIFSLAAGCRLGYRMPGPRFTNGARSGGSGARHLRAGTARRPLGLAVVIGLVIVSAVLFVVKVGGPLAYLRNLGNSGTTTYGLTYLIWGISFAKYGAFMQLGESWVKRSRPGWSTTAVTVVAFGLLGFIGSRLLLLVAALQLLLLYAALLTMGRRFKLVLAVSVAAGLLVFVGLGEVRRWQSSFSHRRSFPAYLEKVGLPNLPRTYVNQYADAVRESVIARRVVPRLAPYERGKEFLRVLLQPLPSSIRPKVSTAPALTAAFTSGKHNGNALAVPVEGYLQFGFVGAIILSLLLGCAVGYTDRIGSAARDVGVLGATVAAGTGAIIVLRGSLAQGVAIATIDIVGFYAAHRLLYRRLRASQGKRMKTKPSTTGADSSTVPAGLSSPAATERPRVI
jgi:hypothetical protein